MSWVVGGPEPVHEINLAEALAFLRLHRLEGWASERCQTGSGQLRDMLEAPLSRRRQAIEQTAATNIALTRRFAKAHAERQRGRLVVMKGITAHMLTGKSATLYEGGDIDLIGDDPQAICLTLEECGFRHGKTPSPHELANMTDGETWIDVHRWIPTLAYPPGLDSVRAEPHSGAMTLLPLGAAVEGALQVESLLSTANSVVRRDGVDVLNPTWAVLLRCVSVFRDYYWQPLLEDSVRLGHVLEVEHLLSACALSIGDVRPLARQWGLEDSLDFFESLLKTLRDPGPSGDALWRIRKCTNGASGPWIRYADGTDPLLMTGTEAIETLDPWTCWASQPGVWTASSIAAQRGLHWATQGKPIDVQFSIEERSDGVKFSIVPELGDNEDWGVSIHCGASFSEGVMMGGKLSIWGVGRSVSDSTHRFEVVLPRSATGGLTEAPLALTCWARGESRWACVVLPLRLAA